MPSANSKRNRRMKKRLEAQKMEKKAVAFVPHVDNSPINQNGCLDVVRSRNPDNCSICNGTKCDEFFRVGYCGCKFGINCFRETYIKECPTCRYKCRNDVVGDLVPNTQENFSRYVAGSMVEVGEFASLAIEDLAESASNFMTSWSADKKFIQPERSHFDNRPPPMDQRERNAVIQNMEIAKAVAGTAATVTGHFAHGVGNGLWLLGSLLSPVVRGVSKQILSEWNVDEERADRIVDNGMEIAKAAVLTTGCVARGVQNGTAILASGACSGLARIYENTHGFQPGELDSNVGEIAKNVVCKSSQV